MTIFKYDVFGKVVDNSNTNNFAKDTQCVFSRVSKIREYFMNDPPKLVFLVYFENANFPVATMFYKIVLTVKMYHSLEDTRFLKTKEKQL